MSVKGLLFDFNGTLFFDSDYHIEAFNRCFEIYGVEKLDRLFIINNIFGCTNEAIFKTHYRPNATDEQTKEFAVIKEKAYTDMCLADPEKLKLCDGAEEMFDYLKKSPIPYCIATGAPLENVEFYFEHLGLGRWFTYDNIVYTDGTFAGKPAPDCYRLAAARLGLCAEDCAIFEDGTSGIRAANASGAKKVIGVWEEGLPSPLTDDTRVDEIHHDLSDWKGILSRLGLM